MKQQLSAATMRSFSAMQVASMFSGIAGGCSKSDIFVPSSAVKPTAGVVGTGVVALAAPVAKALWAPLPLFPMGEDSPVLLVISVMSCALELAPTGATRPASPGKPASVVVVSTTMSSARSRYSFSSCRQQRNNTERKQKKQTYAHRHRIKKLTSNSMEPLGGGALTLVCSAMNFCRSSKGMKPLKTAQR